MKNAHSLATCIYEKGPQTLTDAISKVEKLNDVQQLTATIIPPSTVNILSNEKDHCFQCHEQGHIALNFPNIRCFEYDEYVTLSWIVHTEYLLWELQQIITNPDLTEATMPDQVQGTTLKIGRGKVIPPLGTPANHHQPRPHRSHHARSSSRHHPEDRERQSHSRSDHNLIFTDITAQVVMIHKEATPGHDMGIIAATQGLAHNAHTLNIEITAIDPTTTHPTELITDHPHIEVLQLTTAEIEVDHPHIHPKNLQGEIHTGHIHIPADHKANHTSRRT